MKKILTLLLIIFLVPAFTGCSAVPLLPTETVKAPKPTGEFEGIQNALINSVGNDIVMKYPKCKKTSAAYLGGDIDGDGSEEVLAFYRKTDNTSATRINILKYINGQWQSVCDNAPVGSELERVELSDLDNDGKCEIITGWNVFDSKSFELAIFSFNNNSLIRRTSEKYTDFLITDTDGDGTNEILLLLLNTSAKTSELFCYGFTLDQLTLFSKTQFDGTVANYDDMLVLSHSDSSKTVFIDGYMGNGAMLTEAVSFKNGQPQNLFYNEKTLSTTDTYRPFEINIKIENDGVLVPFAKEMTDSDELEKQYYLEWTKYTGSGFENSYSSIYCAQGKYEIIIEDEWKGKINCSYLDNEKTMIFYEYTSKEEAVSELFRITEVENEKIEGSTIAENMFKLKSGERSAFYTQVIKDNALDITLDTVQRSFIFN